jgi:PAS domain S-box-containing protein
MVTGVITVDVNGRVVTFNSMAERIIGMKIEDVVGRSFLDVFSPKGEIVKVIEGTLRDRCFENYETDILSRDKGLIPVSIYSTVLIDALEKKIGVLLSIIDLTEIKKLENKVRQADKLGALGTMAAGMAHEIKNPLSSLKVFSQLLPQRYQDEEFRKKFMEIIPREITRIDRIVESLLGFTRATSPQLGKVHIEELVEEHLKYYDDQAKKSGVTIIKEYAQLHEIDGDKAQLSQVISNLVLNAIQAMPEGGELKVKIEEGRKVEDVLQEITITVSDTGHGIKEETLKKMFDPFFTTKYGGTGLGLTISHSIVEGHRGTIEVKSEVGKGTTFKVTLPVKQDLS